MRLQLSGYTSNSYEMSDSKLSEAMQKDMLMLGYALKVTFFKDAIILSDRILPSADVLLDKNKTLDLIAAMVLTYSDP